MLLRHPSVRFETLVGFVAGLLLLASPSPSATITIDTTSSPCTALLPCYLFDFETQGADGNATLNFVASDGFTLTAAAFSTTDTSASGTPSGLNQNPSGLGVSPGTADPLIKPFESIHFTFSGLPLPATHILLFEIGLNNNATAGAHFFVDAPGTAGDGSEHTLITTANGTVFTTPVTVLNSFDLKAISNGASFRLGSLRLQAAGGAAGDVSPVPEPSSLLLLAGGLLALGAWRRSKRASSLR